MQFQKLLGREEKVPARGTSDHLLLPIFLLNESKVTTRMVSTQGSHMLSILVKVGAHGEFSELHNIMEPEEKPDQQNDLSEPQSMTLFMVL